MLNLNFSPFPVLTTQRLVLRSLKPADYRAIHTLRSDERVNRYLDRPKSITQEEARHFIKKINGGIACNEWIYWGISLKKGDNLAGTICLWNISMEKRHAEIGYELHPDHQGKGIMQEALSKVIEYGFHRMRLRTIEAYTNAENERSIRLLERNNFIVKRREDTGVIYSLTNEQCM